MTRRLLPELGGYRTDPASFGQVTSLLRVAACLVGGIGLLVSVPLSGANLHLSWFGIAVAVALTVAGLLAWIPGPIAFWGPSAGCALGGVTSFQPSFLTNSDQVIEPFFGLTVVMLFLAAGAVMQWLDSRRRSQRA